MSQKNGHSAAAAELEWSAEVVPIAERFARWRDFVSQALVPLAFERRLEGPFACTMYGTSLGPLNFARIASEPGFVRRTQPLIDRDPGNVTFVNVQLHGAASAERGGRIAHQQAGDLALVDCARPWRLEFHEHFEAICVAVPTDMLVTRLAVPEVSTAVRVPGASGLGAMIVNQIRFLATSGQLGLDHHAARRVADQLVDLLALAVCRAQTLPSSRRALLLQAAFDEIERRLDDPTLCANDIAEHVNISTRYLHRLFRRSRHKLRPMGSYPAT